MRFRSTLILVLVLLGARRLRLLRRVRKGAEEPRRRRSSTSKPTTPPRSRWSTPTARSCSRRGDGGWRLTKPLDAPADDNDGEEPGQRHRRVRGQEELDEPPADLSPVRALDKPLVTVTVKLKDKTLPAILVGKNTPVGLLDLRRARRRQEDRAHQLGLPRRDGQEGQRSARQDDRRLQRRRRAADPDQRPPTEHRAGRARTATGASSSRQAD